MERFWHSLDQYNDLDSRNSFTLLTYNILAEKYATPQMYGYVPSWALLWEYRKQMILHEVLSYDADIICLQVKGIERYRDIYGFYYTLFLTLLIHPL